MYRMTFLALGVLLSAPVVRSQSTSAESQSMQALLLEVRHLRQDLQTAAIGARRIQILIYRLHAQEAAVARATQRLDEANMQLAQLQAQRKYEAMQLKRYEDMKERIDNAAERKQIEDAMAELRERIEAWTPQEQELQTKQTECEDGLKVEQAKLDALQDDLDRIDRALENALLQANNLTQH